MSERVVVPPEMMKAAQLEAFGCDVPVMEFMQRGIEAALFWLSGHPIVPTDEQAQCLWTSQILAGNTHSDREVARLCAVEWQRRIFRAPKPIDPEDVRYQQEMDRLCRDGSFEMKAGFQRGWLAALKTAPPPEPDVPEAVKDLLYATDRDIDLAAANEGRADPNRRILEAHQRGLRGKIT